jgi:hypothetical protein
VSNPGSTKPSKTIWILGWLIPSFIFYCCSLHSVTVRRELRDAADFLSVLLCSSFFLQSNFKSCAGTAISHLICRVGTGHAIEMFVHLTLVVRVHNGERTSKYTHYGRFCSLPTSPFYDFVSVPHNICPKIYHAFSNLHLSSLSFKNNRRIRPYATEKMFYERSNKH